MEVEANVFGVVTEATDLSKTFSSKELDNPTPNMRFNTSCFVDDLVPETYGIARTYLLYSDGVLQLDSCLFRTFKITDHFNLQFRAEMFNNIQSSELCRPGRDGGRCYRRRGILHVG